MRSPFTDLTSAPVNEFVSFTGFTASPEITDPFIAELPLPKEKQCGCKAKADAGNLFNTEFNIPVTKGITAYLNVSAVRSKKLRTGIFIPSRFLKTDKVDIVLYLHGIFKQGGEINGMETYWKTYSNIRDHFYTCQRNAILIAPALGRDPQSDDLILNHEGGLDRFLSACLGAMQSGKYVSASAGINNIIIAAHSAGGKPMAKIVSDKGTLNQRIIECWGFDCLYAAWWANNLKAWATGNKKFYHYWAWSCRKDKLDNCPKVNGEKIKDNPNVTNIAPVGKVTHQQVIENAWLYPILNRPWFTKLKDTAASHEADLSEAEDPTTGIAKAIRLNLTYAQSLGWDKYTEQLNDLLLPYSGMEGVSLGEEAFVSAVAAWQRQQGFSAKDSDGIIGPATWARMKTMLAAVPPVPVPPAASTSSAPSVSNVFPFNQWHAQKILDLINAGIFTVNTRLRFNPKTQLEQIVRGSRVLNINPLSKIIQVLPVIYHIGEQARLANYRQIVVGSFIRESSGGKCTGHCAGRSIDINFSGGSFTTSGSVQMVISILGYLRSFPSQYGSNFGFGLPFQGDFFSNKSLPKFKKTAASNLINRQLQQLIPQLGIVFPDNDNHLHIQIS